MIKPHHRYLDVWVTEDNHEMRATLVEVIDSDAEIMCSLSFDRCEEALAALQKESLPQVILMDIGLLALIETLRLIVAAILNKKDGAWIIGIGVLLFIPTAAYDLLLDKKQSR
jgi:DNA-binding NarL/FixJ family response regulator